jgi:hypothetical protein
MNARRLGMYILCIIPAAVVMGIVINTVPGIVPILFFGFCWYAKPLPTFDEELKTLLRESR